MSEADYEAKKRVAFNHCASVLEPLGRAAAYAVWRALGELYSFRVDGRESDAAVFAKAHAVTLTLAPTHSATNSETGGDPR